MSDTVTADKVRLMPTCYVYSGPRELCNCLLMKVFQCVDHVQFEILLAPRLKSNHILILAKIRTLPHLSIT